MGDDARRIILARRAKFVAAAFAGLSAATCGGETTSDGGNPQPCLSPPAMEDSGADVGPPQPCLSAPYDAGQDAASDAGDASDASDAADGD